MALSGITGVAAAAAELAKLPQVATPAVPRSTATDGAAGAAGAPSFGAQVSNALSSLNRMQNEADALGIQAATGDLDDVHEYTIAATQAEIATQLTVAVRDRAVNAFNEIMRMPV